VTPQRCVTPRERKEAERNTYKPSLQPAWLKHDRQVLRFFTYYQEPVNENPTENRRVRNCTLLYYLEDGTMQVSEPKVENSGIWPQGPFVKRHRIEKADGDFWGPEDLRMGISVTLYGRTFRLVGADEFTKWFYQEVGYAIGTSETAPLDSFYEDQVARKAHAVSNTGMPAEVMESKEYTELKLGGSRKNARLEQFMANDRKVLRFYAYWDDKTRYGSRLYFTVHYYLADDTVEILNSYSRNSGRDPYPVFFTRGPMKKKPSIAHTPGMKEEASGQVRPRDMLIGHTLPVYGRQFFLYDCDESTLAFYDQYLNIKFERRPVPAEAKTHIALSYPPHNGFGCEEDSMGSCMGLMPKPPRKDLVKLMAASSKVLRFEARPRNGLPEDRDRKFIVAYYLSDNTVACYEIKQRNSGQVEGKFRERGELINPRTNDTFKAAEFFIGQTVSISAMPLLLVKADEYTLKVMEKDGATWPMSAPARVAEKLQGFDFGKVGPAVDPEDLRDAVEQQLGFALVDQELVTLLRFYREKDASISMANLQKAMSA